MIFVKLLGVEVYHLEIVIGRLRVASRPASRGDRGAWGDLARYALKIYNFGPCVNVGNDKKERITRLYITDGRFYCQALWARIWALTLKPGAELVDESVCSVFCG